MTGRMYLRKSRGEEDDLELLAAHRSILLRLAKEDGVPMPPEHIIEEIGSADSLAGRPRLVAQLATLPPGAVLYCMDIDRLTKGPLPDRAAIYSALTSAGVKIRTPSQWYDLTLPDDELMFELKALFGRQENAAHHRRVKAKWDDMTRKGVVLTGTAPIGYTWDKNIRNFVVEEIGAALVRALFAEAVDKSSYELSKRYNLRPSSILRILTNPTFTGFPARHCVKHRYAGPKQSAATRYLPREEWTWPEQIGTYPPLVSREQFERVQVALKARHRAGEKTGTTEGWCRGVLEFEGLSGRIELGSHGRKDNRHLIYQVKAVRREFIARSIVHVAAEEAILYALEAPGLAAAAAQAQQDLKAQQAVQKGPQPDPDALIAELSELRSQLDQLLLREIDATDAEEAASIARVRTARRDRAAVVAKELAGLSLVPERHDALDRLLSEFGGLLSGGIPAWHKATETQKRILAGAFLSRLVVRVTPRPMPLPYRREIVCVEYRAWLKTILG